MEKKERPVSGTKEWAKYNENCISGCSHDCKYCYAKTMAIVRLKMKTSENWKNEILRQGQLKRGFRRRQGRFMFPTTHDITPEHLDAIMEFLENILKAGNEVLVVSKPHLDCIRTICVRFVEYRTQILFRFTIGSTDNETLRYWEPGAPSFDERLESLEFAYGSGYATSVSCEPLLDDNADDLIRQVLPFVTDAIWPGKGNKLLSRLRLNGHGDPETIQKATQLMESLSAEFILDLYLRYKENPKVKWKDSLKKVVGIDIPTESGLDI
jgi:DNA repair photolyase